LKILVQTYDTAFQNKAGGVHTRIDRTVSSIKEFGVTIEYFDKFDTDITEYDILHVFKLEISSLGLVRYAKDKGLKVVLSSIVILENGIKIDLYRKLRKLPLMTTYKCLFQILDLVDAVVVETFKEKKFLVKHYHVNPGKITVIPNGADLIESNSNMIFDVLGKKCDYALEVARFDDNKNQIKVIEAVKNTDIEMIFVGGADFTSPEYYKKCVDAAGESKNIHFLGWLDNDSELLKSAYANAKVVLCSSYCETFGLSIVEGVMAGAIPVISKTLPILDYDVFRECIIFEPDSALDIKKKIELAMQSKYEEGLRKKTKESFSWKSVAEQHINLYAKIAGGN